MSVNVREYQTDDEKQIVDLFKDFCDYFISIDPLKKSDYPPGANEVYAKRMTNETKNKEGKIYIAEENNQIAGFIAGIIQRQTKEDLQVNQPSIPGRVIELYVRPDYRGKGVGTTLMKKMEDYFREKGCDMIKIEVFQPNINAHNFYKSLGYSDRVIDLLKLL